MEIQFLGHAALYIKTSTHNILVDPFISGNPKASSINIQDLNREILNFKVRGGVTKCLIIKQITMQFF